MDPTTVYLLLMIGLWLGATSFFIPGTGLAEFGALALLGSAFWLLASLPTNWAAVLLVVAGVSVFIVLPLVRPRYAHYAEFALIPQAFGSFFLFDGMAPSPVAIGAVMLLAFAYNRFMLMPLMERMREAPAVGNEADMLFGAVGRVTAALTPPAAGAAYINGESWTIRAAEPLMPGDTVRVVEVRGLEVTVERIKAKYLPQEIEDEPSNGFYH